MLDRKFFPTAVDVYRANKWDDDLLEEYIGTFTNPTIAQRFCDLMAEHDSENYVIKGFEKPIHKKEKTLEEKFQDKLKQLQKDFATVDKEKNFDFER